ncbi:Putative quinone oxidoreductase YhfP [Roseimaritima multifibrata]|uniref:Quinone oxidoreductase YhfP n=1 Tax=Roseimaritima multifibrata TaxID=1930274 RepID=A0A517MGJ1_9BACT|nr:oxidoreductase [Roseimaritima multifibrata]QDS93989.1 Putative quinone oxidoreductase YhfP [Roseimaritima multifibrata]
MSQTLDDNTTFQCYRIQSHDGEVSGSVETCTIGSLPEGEVLIRAAFSDVNYKDALAATGHGKIIRDFPLIGGIDVSGRVESSTDNRFKPGDAVVVTGCGLGERHDGGFSEFVRVPADWVVPLSDALSLQQAMAVGTAGFTAALAIDRMELCGQTPDGGSVLVTGATGGVGSFAINMLKGRGYEVTALTGKPSSADYLRELGASEVLIRGDLEMGTRPLERAKFAGAIDSLGGDVLSWITRVIQPSGNIASIGLAGGSALNTTVMPFILRGINLLGIDSVNVPQRARREVWKRIATDLRPSHFDKIVTRQVTLGELNDVFKSFIDGQVTGRTIVKISDVH